LAEREKMEEIMERAEKNSWQGSAFSWKEFGKVARNCTDVVILKKPSPVH